jgi:hypothetical protein
MKVKAILGAALVIALILASGSARAISFESSPLFKELPIYDSFFIVDVQNFISKSTTTEITKTNHLVYRKSRNELALYVSGVDKAAVNHFDEIYAKALKLGYDINVEFIYDNQLKKRN